MLVHKTKQSTERGLEFILSDGSVDRYDDLIEPSGWDLRAFSKNPIALWQHDTSFPIGTWHDLGVRGDALRGRLCLAPLGTSERIDEIHRLVEAGVLRSVSVGFIPIESEPRGNSKGTRYKRQSLVETSLVAVPANANALLQARALGVSNETLKLIFKEGQQSVADRIAYSKAVVARARAMIAKVEGRERREAKKNSRSKPKLLTMSETARAKYDRSRVATAKARAILAKGSIDRVQQDRPRQDRTPSDDGGTYWQGQDVTLRWRGWRILTTKWRGEK
jgi:HK97 family phage prohead protease